MDKKQLLDEISNLESKMKNLESLNKPSYSQRYELGAIYFELSHLWDLAGDTKSSRLYAFDWKAEFKELRELTLNDPLCLTHEKQMYDFVGEELPRDLKLAYRRHEEEINKSKRKKGLLKRLLGSEEIKNNFSVDGNTIYDVISKVLGIKDSLEVSKADNHLKREMDKNEIANSLEKALVDGMYVASLDDYEIQCGVEGDYLRSILSEDEMRDVGGIREKIENGEIDLSQMPQSLRSYNFGRLLLKERGFEETEKQLGKKLVYLTRALNNTRDKKERQALEVLKNEVKHQLIPRKFILDNPELLLQTGNAVINEGPTDIETSDDRKMFYFINVVTRAMKPYMHQLRLRMNHGDSRVLFNEMGSINNPEDVYGGWEILKESYPIFKEVEKIGVPAIARAFRELGYIGMKDAVRGLIKISEDTPYHKESNRLVRLIKTAVDAVQHAENKLNQKLLDSKH